MVDDSKKSSENRQLQNSVDDDGNIIAINLDAKVGARVQRPPVVKKLGEAFVVASERASRIVAETLAHRFYRAVEPNCHAVILNQLPIAQLGERAASQRDNTRMTCFNPLHATANRLGLKIAKAAFASLIEDLRDGFPLGGFNLAVNIGKGPAELIG